MRSRENNPNNRNQQSNQHSDPQLQELNGLGQLGLVAEATKLAITLLSIRPLKQLQFTEAVDALLSHAEDFVSHTPLIVQAYQSMSAANQKACRTIMLHCHLASKDYNAALPFVIYRVTSRTDSFDIACSIDVLLACKRIQDAESLVARSFHRVMNPPSVLDDHDAALINSVSKFFYAMKRWDYAILGWKELLENTLFGPAAAVDMTLAYAQKALETAQQGITRIAQMRKTEQDVLQITLPNVQDDIYSDAENDLKTLSKSLASIVENFNPS